MVQAANLGFPRIGKNRELKKAQEAYWKGIISKEELLETGKTIRKENWEFQKQAGLDVIPSNDFSFYDQVLDTIALVGAIPERYQWKGKTVDLDTYFAMARGAQGKGIDVKAMEMTKWFDTNYHFIVPELHKNQHFSLSSTKIFDEFREAKSYGITTRPVLLGPVTFLSLAKTHDAVTDKYACLANLLPVYEAILNRLEQEGAEWVQIDEPCLGLDLPPEAQQAYKDAFKRLRSTSKLKILVATYFSDTEENLDLLASLPIDGIHLDLVRAPGQLKRALKLIPKHLVLSLGVVDGRNIWRNDFEASLALIRQAQSTHNLIQVAPSCSLLHTPVSLEQEKQLDKELKQWLAFATEKVKEVVVLAHIAANNATDSVKKALEDNTKAQAARGSSARIHNPKVKARAASVTPEMKSRKSPYGTRKNIQKKELKLPLFPTTTIGSFPQTQEVRTMRAKFKKGEINQKAYEAFLEEETIRCIRKQEELGLDALVHGEFERNDMVEYFGEQLNGFAFTENGWVQSYGSRCVKPPVIFGDVSRDAPMTIRWITFAQKHTSHVMKGMLTGPVTILQWSFVRNDQPRSETCKQIALAIRDEVEDLEKAGIKIIQIDEAALREGLPLRKKDWKAYLQWAVESFRITACGVADKTQIHTHMCYSEFNDIIEAVAKMDTDVISIETSRSQMELLDAFASFKYPNEIGPGVYDIHSPRIPEQKEMEELLYKALDVLTPEQLWVNPDCGLKTRGWKEVEPALRAMVDAAKRLRNTENTHSRARVS